MSQKFTDLAAADALTGDEILAVVQEGVSKQTTAADVAALGGGGGGGTGALAGINDQTGTSYTLVLSDAGKDIRCNNGATVTITIPPNSDVAFPVGTFLFFSQAGTGTVTAAAGSGVTLNAYSGYSTAGQHDVRGLEQVAADVWRVV